MTRQEGNKFGQDHALRGLAVVDRDIAALKPFQRNARTHSRKQIHQIAESIRAFGFTNPILIDANDRVIAGHGRIEAARLLGMESVPTIRLERLTEAQLRAYVIADNRLAENAGWDRDLLALELQYITEIDIDFDLTITGFEAAEIDVLMEGVDAADADDEADRLPAIDETAPTVTRLGDVWVLGRHRLICADATRERSFERLMDGKRARMIFTDPPYNLPIDGHVCGLGRTRHTDFVMASGEMTGAQFTAFLNSVFGHLVAHSVDGSIHFVCMDWRHMYEILSAARGVYAKLKNVCVWNKDNGGMGSLYRSKHEFVFVFKNGTAPHINNVELGRHGRYRTNVWDYPGVNSMGADRLEAFAMHPTVKPVALVADAIMDCSRRGDIVLDCFAGSGTTLIAAERAGRCSYTIEMDPRYVDVAVERFQRLTGEVAVHADTRLTFAETRGQRADGESAGREPASWSNGVGNTEQEAPDG